MVSKITISRLWHITSWLNVPTSTGEPVVIKESSGIVHKSYDAVVDLRNMRLNRCSFNHLQFRFIQREHRGGFCDCWEVANLTATLTSGIVKRLR